MESYNYESVGIYISFFHRLSSNYLTKKFIKYDLGFGQYQFLLRLYLCDGCSHEELTEKTHVDKATTTRAIKKLEENGYVTIKPNEKDKRKYIIHLTEKALSQREEIFEICKHWENHLTGALSPEELENLYVMFRKIAIYNEEHSLD